jgi:hypothetical protein
MELKTTAILAACGVVLSGAAAFAVPIGKPALATVDPSSVTSRAGGSAWSEDKGARLTTGDTLLVDARLGHASLSKGSAGETYLFAQVTAGGDKTAPSALAPMNLAVVIDRSGPMKANGSRTR